MTWRAVLLALAVLAGVALVYAEAWWLFGTLAGVR